jgi:putative ABC transport system ATP-binding protein
MIELRGVEKRFGSATAAVLALAGVDLLIPKGQMCALIGPSGAGKSTVLHLVAGLTRPDQGEVHVAGRDLASMSDAELTLLRRQRIGIVFQFFNLLPYLTARENVALPLELEGLQGSEIRARVNEALQLVGVAHRAEHAAADLSGGEMQRVAVARCLVIRPDVILADEPTGNLDTTSGRQVMNLLRDVNEQTGVTILIVTHDPIWATIGDRIVRIRDGRIAQDIDLLEETADASDGEPEE